MTRIRRFLLFVVSDILMTLGLIGAAAFGLAPLLLKLGLIDTAGIYLLASFFGLGLCAGLIGAMIRPLKGENV